MKTGYEFEVELPVVIKTRKEVRICSSKCMGLREPRGYYCDPKIRCGFFGGVELKQQVGGKIIRCDDCLEKTRS